jgi:hypothetical protein
MTCGLAQDEKRRELVSEFIANREADGLRGPAVERIDSK